MSLLSAIITIARIKLFSLSNKPIWQLWLNLSDKITAKNLFQTTRKKQDSTFCFSRFLNWLTKCAL